MNVISTDQDDNLPKIIYFQSSSAAVQNKEPFSLYWEAKGATRVEIYRNGILLERRSGEETSISISESYDGKDKEVEYYLVAFNDHGQSESLPISVSVRENVERPDEIPEIIFFTASAIKVQNKESFTLNWEVTRATSLNIYRNGILFRKPDIDTTSISINETYDGKEKEIIYTLHALSKTVQSKSSPVTVTVTDKVPLKPALNKGRKTPAVTYDDITPKQERYHDQKERNLKKIRMYLWGLLATIIITVLLVAYFILNKPKILDFDPKALTEEHTVVIVGKNFPKDPGKLQILFNNVKGSIEYNSPDIIRAVVPTLGDKIGDGNVRISLVVTGDTIHASKTLVVSKIAAPKEVPVTQGLPFPAITTDSVRDTMKMEPVKKKPKTTAARRPTIVTSPVSIDTQPAVKINAPAKIIDIYKMVKVTSNEFKRRTFGGVKDLELTVQNDSPYDLDNVHVLISYLKKNEKKIRNETIVFPNIRAHTSLTKQISDSNRGSKVEYKITLIQSKQLDKQKQN